MNKELLKERAKVRIIKLRQLASIGDGTENEALRVFKEIEKDPKCNWILRQSSMVESDETIIEFYDEHIRQSKLSDSQKRNLIIKQ